MSQDLSKRSSRLIDAIRFPLILMVIFAHSTLLESNTPVSGGFIWANVFHTSELFFRSLGAIAVAGFALISGYFFFFKEQFTYSYYRKAIFKRKNTLLYPYILWNTIAFLALWAKNFIAQRLGFSLGVNTAELNLLDSYSIPMLFSNPIDAPLWYIRELIIITLASPIVGLALRYLKRYAILIFAAIYLIPINLGLAHHILFFFCLGAYLSKLRLDMVIVANKLRYFGLIGTIFFFIALFFFCDSSYYLHIRSITLIAVVIFLLNLIDYLDKSFPRFISFIQRLTPAVFFIYAIHTLVIINLIRGTLYQSPLASHSFGQITITILTAILTAVLSYIIYSLMKKIMPKIVAILCGGRA